MVNFAVTVEECPASTGKAWKGKIKKQRFSFHAEKSLEKFIWGESK